jgi:hypothetical protein
MDEKPKSKWENEEELLLKDWAEKAMCYKWLHTKANKKFSKINMAVTIPVIIISTITGTANFAQERIPENHRSMFTMIIGTLNICAGVITTISQYFQISEINEGHRIASLSWDKFSRNIKIQLTKRPSNREDSSSLMKYAKDEFDRLMEISPDIPEEIIKLFKSTLHTDKDPITIINNNYKDDETIPKAEVIKLIKMKRLADGFNKPDICDNLSEITIYSQGANETVKEKKLNLENKFKVEFKNRRGRSPTIIEMEEGIQLKSGVKILN